MFTQRQFEFGSRTSARRVGLAAATTLTMQIAFAPPPADTPGWLLTIVSFAGCTWLFERCLTALIGPSRRNEPMASTLEDLDPSQVVIAAFKGLPHRVFWKDHNLIYRGCNRNFARDAGLDRASQVIGKTDYDLPWTQEEATSFRLSDRHVLESGQSLPATEECRRGPDGSSSWVMISKTPLKAADGRVVGVIGIYSDVTEAYESQRALQEAHEALAREIAIKEGFLATVTHEMRTPVTGILGLTEILGDSKLEPAERDAVSTLQLCANSLRHLVNDLLDLSKLEAGSLELDPRDMDLALVAEEAIEIVAPSATQKEVEIALEVGRELAPSHMIDDQRLRQVLLNLISNAVKFTREGSIIVRLGAEPLNDDQQRLRIEVEDSGCGMNPEQQERVFEPFMQASSSTSRSHGGTGLGLSICRRIAEVMGGQIAVRSKLGEGSTFSVEFPCAIGKAARREMATDPPRVAIVAQSPLLARAHASRIERLGGSARHFESLAAIPAGSNFNAWLVDGDAAQDASTPPDLNAQRLIVLTREPQAESVWPTASARLTKPLRRADLRRALLGEWVDRPHMPSPVAVDRKARLLVADDNPVNRRVLEHQMQSLGHRVVVVADGDEAIDAMRTQDFDLVFLDCEMPRLGGFDATRQARAEGFRKPIFALTAHAANRVEREARSAGMDGVISKPVALEDLRAVVTEHLSTTLIAS